jgi:hypothetical protein
MDDGNNSVISNQTQTNLPTDNSATNPVYSVPAPQVDTNPSSESPVSTNDITDNSQTPDPTPPQLAQTSYTDAPGIEDSQLEEIKRNALQNLLPIVGKLDQSLEEKFQTLLMVIQASDNRNLINEAYESAAKIPDEGKRAQALLAIINEINFFTQQPPKN